jgi:hypothetical protein
MQANKLSIEYSSESNVCEVELMTITANQSLYGLFDNGNPDYFITITSETGISFNNKEELINIIDNFVTIVERCRNN